MSARVVKTMTSWISCWIIFHHLCSKHQKLCRMSACYLPVPSPSEFVLWLLQSLIVLKIYLSHVSLTALRLHLLSLFHPSSYICLLEYLCQPFYIAPSNLQATYFACCLQSKAKYSLWQMVNYTPLWLIRFCIPTVFKTSQILQIDKIAILKSQGMSCNASTIWEYTPADWKAV